jgi:hypothetical protein
MGGHLQDHWGEGGHIWGLIWLRPCGTIRTWSESLVLIWEITEAEEWLDKLDWIPY